MGNQDEGIRFNSIGSTLYPLFCVSVHEHAWMSAGYGIWGKEEYLKRFWTVLDWKNVSESSHRAGLEVVGVDRELNLPDYQST